MKIQYITAEESYLIVSCDSLLIMCQSIHIITPEKKYKYVSIYSATAELFYYRCVHV